MMISYSSKSYIMSTISIPISGKQEEFIKSYIEQGNAENKAAVVRKALDRLAEESAIQAVLDSEQEIREGKVLHGDLRKLIKKFR